MNSHVKLPASVKAVHAVVCGSPERAKILASRADSSELVAQNREYHSYLARRGGFEFLIVSHGVGAPGAAICFQELIGCGVRSMIRIGTAGALYERSGIADIVLPVGAVRNDGLSSQMIPTAFPAVPDLDLTLELRAELRRSGASFKSGVIVTADLFYKGLIDDQLALYRDAGAVAVEMECSTLFVIGTLRKAKTGALLVVDGEPLNWDKGVYNPDPAALQRSVDVAFDCAVAALQRA